jgi:hypothetical protein
MSSFIAEAIKRPFEWLVSLLLLPFKLLISLVGKVISITISLIVFFLILGAVLSYGGFVSVPSGLTEILSGMM